VLVSRDVVSDKAWAVIGPLFPAPKATGRPPVDRRTVPCGRFCSVAASWTAAERWSASRFREHGRVVRGQLVELPSDQL